MNGVQGVDGDRHELPDHATARGRRTRAAHRGRRVAAGRSAAGRGRPRLGDRRQPRSAAGGGQVAGGQGHAAGTAAHRHPRAAPDHWNHLDPDVLRWKQAGDAAALLRDTGELRRIVEPEAARLAAERAGPNDVRALRDALAAMESAAASPARGGYVEADIAFTGPCWTPAATGSSAPSGAPWRSRCGTASTSVRRPRARWRPRCRVTGPSYGPSRPVTRTRRRRPCWGSSRRPGRRSPGRRGCRGDGPPPHEHPAAPYDVSHSRMSGPSTSGWTVSMPCG